jgi:cathepsin F
MDPPIPGNPCRFDPSKVVPGTGNAFFNASTGGATSEDQLAAFIHHNGPVSAGINSDVFGLRVKGCGVGPGQSPCFITKDMCLQVVDEIDHSTTFVGYGVDPQNGPYWLVKNSWGAKWANEGFIMVARGVGCAGICGGNVSHDSSICGNVFTHGSPDSYYPPSLLA